MIKTRSVIAGVFVAVTFGARALYAAAPFYEGKTIRIVVGAAPGGGFDTYSRAIARHMGKYIPGNPAIIVDNMPGAGFMIAVNHLYKVAKPDGLTLGNWIGTLVLAQAVGRKGLEFDVRKFEYVGSPVKNHDVCVMTKASGITSVEKWLAASTPVKLGSTPPGATTYENSMILKEALGLPIQVVAGYKGTSEIRVAAEAGEVAGLCGISWASAKSTWRKALEAGDALVVLQNAPSAHPELPNVPLAISLAKTEDARKLIAVGIHDVSAITYLYSLPPGTPKERVQLVRKAFMETMRDAEFLAEASKANMDLAPASGEELEKIVGRFFNLEPSIASRLREIVK
ncbi:MAG TPA: tripartite tricarboxylate transporter substrate-binding protein [Candidatus Acidoferrales bacterium]|nr:tripartite tricarboxylate transporter substrate-binding protein [Candidatus Acidoferrales bacterium]